MLLTCSMNAARHMKAPSPNCNMGHSCGGRACTLDARVGSRMVCGACATRTDDLLGCRCAVVFGADVAPVQGVHTRVCRSQGTSVGGGTALLENMLA